MSKTPGVAFNSFEFLGFLAIVLAIYYAQKSCRLQMWTVILASLYFYSADDFDLVWLLASSILVNACLSWQIGRGTRWLIAFGITANLCVLATFKYGPLLAELGLSAENHWSQWLSRLPLPIGISFFTFEAIVVLLDASRRRESLVSKVEKVGFLISFFPHLISGPILKAQEFFPQLGRKRFQEIEWERAFRCLTLGYFLKMVVADNLKEQTLIMDHYQGLSSVLLVVLLFAYSFQIFADFAGYSLIAIGLGALLGYRLPKNFDFPYMAASFSEFWRRWHITLSTFLKDYLYIPLGGNRGSFLRTQFNLMVVMVLGGLWHGAAWRYAVWGMMHGIALVFERTMSRFVVFPSHGVWRAGRILGVFSYVSLAWVFFRLDDFATVKLYLLAIVSNLSIPVEVRPLFAVGLFALPVILYHVFHVYRPGWLNRQIHWAYSIMLFLILTNSGPPGSFIYFQF